MFDYAKYRKTKKLLGICVQCSNKSKRYLRCYKCRKLAAIAQKKYKLKKEGLSQQYDTTRGDTEIPLAKNS